MHGIRKKGVSIDSKALSIPREWTKQKNSDGEYQSTLNNSLRSGQHSSLAESEKESSVYCESPIRPQKKRPLELPV